MALWDLIKNKINGVDNQEYQDYYNGILNGDTQDNNNVYSGYVSQEQGTDKNGNDYMSYYESIMPYNTDNTNNANKFSSFSNNLNDFVKSDNFNKISDFANSFDNNKQQRANKIGQVRLNLSNQPLNNIENKKYYGLSRLLQQVNGTNNY